MTSHPSSMRKGVTIIELLIVMVLVGILAGIAIPNFQNAVWRARAAEVVTDVHTVTLAYHQFLADGGGVVGTAAWGQVPAALEPYLADGFSFSTEVADYRWVRVKASSSPWDVEMGMLRVRPLEEFKTLMMPKLAAMPRCSSLGRLTFEAGERVSG